MAATTPSLVIVTDRRLVPSGHLVPRLLTMLDAVPAGAALVQVREKDLDGGALWRLVSEIVAVARPRGAAVLVNDRLDVALAAGADGVHLPESGLEIATARAVAARAGRDRIVVGCSRHTAAAARAAADEGADLVVLGPIWPTPSKAALGEPLGEAVLATSIAATLVAIGGIDSPDRARTARAAGANAVAAIRYLWTAADPGAAARALAGASA